MGKKLQKTMKEKQQGKKYHSNQNQNRYGNKFHSLSLISEPSVVEEDRNKNDDWISNLPDCLLQHILYSLSLESVAQTRILSTRWRDAWNVDFVRRGSQMDLVLAVGDLIHSFNLMCPLKHPWNYRLQFHTQELGFFIVATFGITKKLHLDFSHSQTLQPFFLHLELTNLNPLTLSRAIPFQVQSLCLTSVNHLSKDIVSSLLLPSFQFVKTLEIRKCEGLFAMEVLWELKLRHVSIIDCVVDSLVILSDELRSFRYRGSVPHISFIDECNFKDVMLDFRQGPGCYTDSYLESNLPLLPLLNRAEYITLCQWSFEVMMRRELCAKDRCKYLKELWWIDSSMEKGKIDSLVSFLSVCPNIEKLFVTIDPKCYCLHQRIGSNSSSKVGRKSEQLRYLKVVKMDGFENEENEMLLADHIFSICSGEPKMVASSGNNSCTRRLVRFSPKRRRFVEEVDDQLLNAKHKHMCI